jgi:hypothetical protein
LTALAQALDAK